MSTIMKRQNQASPQRGLPVDVKTANSVINTVTGETVQFYYSNAGVRTIDAGEAAGTAVEAVLARNNVKNANGRLEATNLDTSLSFTSTAFTTEVPFIQATLESLDDSSWSSRLEAMTASLSNGQYCVDYTNGILYGKKASTQVTLASTTYKTEVDAISTSGSPSNVLYTAYEAKSFTISGAQNDYNVATQQTMFAVPRTKVLIKSDIACTLELNASTSVGQIVLAAGEQITIDQFSITNIFITTTGDTAIRIVAFS